MKNKGKRFVAGVLLATFIANPRVYVDAKNNATVSFSQKIKNGIQSIRNVIKNNAKEVAILGIGGGGLFALVLMGIVCNKKGSSRADGGCDSQSSQDSVEKPILGAKLTLTIPPIKPGASRDSRTDSKTVTKVSTESESNPVTVTVSDTKSEFEPATDVGKFSGTSSVAVESLVVIDEPKIEPEVKPEPKCEQKGVVCSRAGAELESAPETESGMPQKTIMLPKFVADVYDDPISRTPSPGSDVVEMNDDLKGVKLRFSEDLNHHIVLFCGGRYSVDDIRAIIEFLAKIKNKHHRGRNITSLVEANFTRCEQKINGFNTGERTVDFEVIGEFKGHLVAIGKQFGVAQWKEFKEKLLRGIVLNESRLEFDVNRLVAKMK